MVEREVSVRLDSCAGIEDWLVLWHPDRATMHKQTARKCLGMSGTLYVVATPIGHLGDISRRGIDTLNHVGIIAAEDTRRTRVLLQHIDHTGCELVSVHEHNEERVGPVLIERMRQGTDIALVSDAGTLNACMCIYRDACMLVWMYGSVCLYGCMSREKQDVLALMRELRCTAGPLSIPSELNIPAAT